MYRHGPNCLEGPVTRSRGWWTEPDTPNLATQTLPADWETAPMDDCPAETNQHRPIRSDLVERVRREIAAGTYETPEKWDIALDRLLKRLEGE